ncbi:MAG: hypothetical protein ACE5EE_04965 [Fidelibacterota bacterium]
MYLRQDRYSQFSLGNAFGLFMVVLSAIGFNLFSCSGVIISDTILPEEVKIVPDDHELYDGRQVVFANESGSWSPVLPSSLSGRKYYHYEDLMGVSGVVEGEYEIDHGRYVVIRFADGTLVKVASEVFLEVTDFIKE